MVSSSSSSSPLPPNYQVFLSFHGKDTRKTFVSYLYAALCAKGIVTFKDDQELEKGDHIATNLRRAIEVSKLAVVVLSQNYTSSKWCLMELVLIMESYERGTLKVFPIFYEVDPSDVRKQRGSFSLKQYKKDPKVPKWANALTLIAGLTGVDSRHCPDEYKMLEEMVEDISSQLDFLQPTSFKDVVCMEAHIEQMGRLLEIESDAEARMVGIWGMAGIGKTTIAKYLYEQYARLFSFHCFIENVDKLYNFDLKGLQTQLLGDTLHSKRVSLRDEHHGATLIQSRLGNHKVFLVIDGVDKVEQLDALAREATWFGKGSRIIITTRDKRLLDCHSVVNKYKVECLGSEDSLKMFKHFAYRGGVPPFDAFDERLAIRASQLAHGLPFALEALGKYFRGATSNTEWKADIATFETAPHRNIMDILRSSYTNLDPTTKLTFLRIACLFNGEPESSVSAILETSIRGLADKSLIHISDDGCINMHYLIQQMGREIVSKDIPQQQAILWDPLNCYAVLQRNTGTEIIEGMAMHTCELPRGLLPVNGSAFNQIHNLKFVKFFKHMDDIESNLDLTSGNCMLLPLCLKLLHWDGYPLTTLPPNFPLGSLVELHLRHSNLETLWDGKPSLPKLKILDVTGSKNLIELPDLSSAPKLEDLLMKGCKRLTQILKATDDITTLRKLDVSHCDNLMTHEMTIREFPDLEYSSHGVSQVSQQIARTFPDVDVVATTNSLKNLSIQCQITFRLDYLVGNAAHLSFSSEQQILCALTLNKIQKKSNLHATFHGCKSLDIMQFSYKKDGSSFKCYSFSRFVSLTELNLINLNIQNIPDNIGLLEELQKLDLSGNDFRYLPKEMENLSKLKSLRLCNCPILVDLPKLTQLETLKLSDCIQLQPFLHGSKSLLQQLWLDNCNNVKELSLELSHCTNLTHLDLSRNDLVKVPTSITKLALLGTLCLSDSNNLKSLTELPLSLKYLYAKGCKSLENVVLPYGHSMKHIDLSYCPKLTKVEELINQFLTFRQNQEVTQRFAFLPGRIVPSYFDNQASSLPQIWHTSESEGFDVCIKISCESPYQLQLSSSSYSCKQKGNWFYRIKIKPSLCIPSEGISSSNEEKAVSEHHLFIFHVQGNVNVNKFRIITHLELPEEFQSTVSTTTSYRIRVHHISCGDLTEKRKPQCEE